MSKEVDNIKYLEKNIPTKENEVLYPTGFFEFDFQNGHRVFNKKTGKYEYKMGIVDGCMVGVIGRSNAGKSTFSIQLAGNLVRPFEKSKIIHLEIEQGCSNDVRNMNLLKMDRETYHKKYVRYNSNITIETLEELINLEMKYKLDNAKELRYNTGNYDINGEPIFKFYPTVVIIDSIPCLISEKVMNNERTNMDSANIANGLTSFIKKYTQKIKSYNIIIIAINQFRKEINTSIYAKRSEMPGLKQDETMPGGVAFKYNITYLLRLEDLTKFKEGEEFGISGCYVDLIAAKTRQGEFWNKSKLYFNGEQGFIDYLSNFNMLKERGIIEQSGAYYKLPYYEKKVTKKQVIELYKNDKDFRNALNKSVAECIEKTILTYEDESYDEVVDNEINDVLSFLV